MGEGVRPAEAAIGFNVSKPNPVPGVDLGDARETEWANFGTVLTVTVTDSDYAAGGLRNTGAADTVDITVESDEFDSQPLVFNNVTEVAGDAGVFTVTFQIDEFETALIGATVVGAPGSDPGDPTTCPSIGGVGTAATANCVHTGDDDFILIIFQTNAGVELDAFQVTIDNEQPDIRGLSPEHEDVLDDNRVDFEVEVTDANSGIPVPEDLSDPNTNEDYTTILFLRSGVQCADQDVAGGADGLLLDAAGAPKTIAAILAADCNGVGGADITVHEVSDEDDFDEIDDGFAVDTRITLGPENANFVTYITVLAFDAAGNYRVFDADRSGADVVLAEITVDPIEPAIDVARTGVTWNAADEKYDDARDYIQIVFEDASNLDPSTIQSSDVVVSGHGVRRIQWFDVEPEEINGGPESRGAPHPWSARPKDVDGTPFVPTGAECRVTAASLGDHAGAPGAETFVLDVNGDTIVDVGDVVTQAFCENADLFVDGTYPYVGNFNAFIKRTIFVQLEDELDPDERPDVNIVPNGIADEAGNVVDGSANGEYNDAEDFIAPEFQVLELTGPITGKLLAGEDDQMELIITSDEDLDGDPRVTITLVNAPAGCVVGGAGANACPFAINRTLTRDVDEIGNNRWRVEINEPTDTGYYNIHITGEDREGNEGSEGIAPASIAGNFFKSNGDVNTDDAIFFQGDIALPPPLVRIAGIADSDDFDEVEFRTPFFIELNFTLPEDDADVNPAGVAFAALDEDGEYLKDSFDDVQITLFELDGVDLTDQVSTTDNQRFLIAIDNIAFGEHTIVVEARDEAGNEFDDDVEVDFEVEERSPFELEVRPGWNLFSVPGAPSDGAIDAVFGPGVPVTTLYTFDPTVPGGWLVAVRETSDDPWTGSLMEIDPSRGYWGLSSAIFEVDVDIPRIAGGSAGGGTPVQPPTVDLFPGWNLVPVIDVSGDKEFEDKVDADVYFGGVRDSVRQIVTFNTITNVWETVPFFEDILLNSDGSMSGTETELRPDSEDKDDDGDETELIAEEVKVETGADFLNDTDLAFGKAYWVFATGEATLVPGSN
jgi:hypothetical protein